MKGKLILENGTVFEGKLFGYLEESVGEVVFNTSMTGYEKILTNPANCGQIVVMTYPLIGNYGINLEDLESDRVAVKGLTVREKSDYPNNWRCEMTLESFLKQNKVIGIEGIDTRALTKILRNKGTMRGLITSKDLGEREIEEEISCYTDGNFVKEVSRKNVLNIEGKGKHIAVIDLGLKNSTIDYLQELGFKISIFPALAEAEEVLKANPDLIFISNGPGNPENLKPVIENINKFIGIKPILGVSLGNILLAMSFGGEVQKMKFGHRGCNYPVKDLFNEKVYITSQNHGYTLKKLPENMIATHVNVNDETIEGMRHENLPILGLMFDPEDSFEKDEFNQLLDKYVWLNN